MQNFIKIREVVKSWLRFFDVTNRLNVSKIERKTLECCFAVQIKSLGISRCGQCNELDTKKALKAFKMEKQGLKLFLK